MILMRNNRIVIGSSGDGTGGSVVLTREQGTLPIPSRLQAAVSLSTKIYTAYGADAPSPYTNTVAVADGPDVSFTVIFDNTCRQLQIVDDGTTMSGFPDFEAWTTNYDSLYPPGPFYPGTTIPIFGTGYSDCVEIDLLLNTSGGVLSCSESFMLPPQAVGFGGDQLRGGYIAFCSPQNIWTIGTCAGVTFPILWEAFTQVQTGLTNLDPVTFSFPLPPTPTLGAVGSGVTMSSTAFTLGVPAGAEMYSWFGIGGTITLTPLCGTCDEGPFDPPYCVDVTEESGMGGGSGGSGDCPDGNFGVPCDTVDDTTEYTLNADFWYIICQSDGEPTTGFVANQSVTLTADGTNVWVGNVTLSDVPGLGTHTFPVTLQLVGPDPSDDGACYWAVGVPPFSTPGEGGTSLANSRKPCGVTAASTLTGGSGGDLEYSSPTFGCGTQINEDGSTYVYMQNVMIY